MPRIAKHPFEDVRLEVNGPVATITIDRPRSLNSLTSRTLRELAAALMVARRDRKACVIVLTGAGRAFSAGADIRELSRLTPAGARRFARLGRGLVSIIESSKKPVVAVVNGYALGGGLELATACDMIIATEESILGVPAVKLGAFSVWGVTQRLLHMLSPLRTKEILLLGKTIDGARAERMGLVSLAVPAKSLRLVVRRMVRDLAENAPMTMAMYKSILNQSIRHGRGRGSQAELKAFLKCLRSRDFAEGVEAFLRRRRPRFVGR